MKKILFCLVIILSALSCDSDNNPIAFEKDDFDYEGNYPKFNELMRNKILISSNRNVIDNRKTIHLLNNDNGSIETVTDEYYSGQYCWSPRKWKFVFLGSKYGDDVNNPKLYISDYDGKNIHPISNETDKMNWWCIPAWSPDGQKIAYIVYDNNSDNSKIKIITPDGKLLLFTSDYLGNIRKLTWSSDSKLIYFTNGLPSLYALSITDKKVEVKLNFFIGSSTSCSPNGRYFTYHGNYTENNISNTGIYIYNIENQQEIRLTDNNYIAYDPSWSYDGNYIFYTAIRRDLNIPRSIGRVNFFTKEIKIMTDSLGWDESPCAYK